MSQPKVSIIIPTYNYGRYIQKAIDSVLAQTFQDFEIIVVDDGSIDNTREIIECQYKDKVRYFYQEHKGAPAARNRGIEESKGEYLVFLDADDYFLPENLEKKIKFLDTHPKYGWVYSDGYFIDETTQKKERASVRLGYNKLGVKAGNILRELLIKPIIPTLAVMIRKECLEKVGDFDERLPCLQDYDLWIRVASLYSVGYIDEPLYVKVLHRESISNRTDKEEGYKARLYLIEKIEANYPSVVKDIDWRWKKIKADIYNFLAYRALREDNLRRFITYALRSISCYPFQRLIYITMLKEIVKRGLS